jgi:hypothetical protein
MECVDKQAGRNRQCWYGELFCHVKLNAYITTDTAIGEALHLTEVQQSTKAQYDTLTAEEKTALAEEFRTRPEKVIRANARSRTHDVLNVVNNMQSLVSYHWRHIHHMELTFTKADRLKQSCRHTRILLYSPQCDEFSYGTPVVFYVPGTS